MRPDEVVPAPAVTVLLTRDTLSDLGHHQVRQPDQVPVVDTDPRVGELSSDCGTERGRGVDRDDFDPVAPGLGSGLEPGRDRGTVAACQRRLNPASAP